MSPGALGGRSHAAPWRHTPPSLSPVDPDAVPPPPHPALPLQRRRMPPSLRRAAPAPPNAVRPPPAPCPRATSTRCRPLPGPTSPISTMKRHAAALVSWIWAACYWAGASIRLS